MPPEDSSTSQDEQTSPDQARPSGTSYASIQKPQIAGDGDDQHILLWGRFWGDSRDLYVAFAINLNIDEFHFVTEEFLLFQEPAKLEPFDPDQHFSRFQRTFSEHVSNGEIPEATTTQVRQSFRNYLESSRNEENLVKCFREKNREEFSDHAYEIVNDIFPKGSFTYQFKAELSTLDTFEDESEEEPSEGAVERGNNDEEAVKEEDYLNVKPVTSPMNGDFPGELNVGETVFVRTAGDVTGNLPENLQSEDHESLSVPLEATVRSISAEVDLPAGFDGDAENYWELTVNLLDGHVGRCFIHKNTQIKAPDPETTTDDRLLAFSPTLLFAAGLVLLGCLLLAYLIFGI